jgi:GSCFA family
MTVQRKSFEDAWLTLKGNKNGTWFVAGETDRSRMPESLAVTRIHTGLARIEPQPRRPVADRVFFTIGSCFARVIELELLRRKVPVPNCDRRLFQENSDLFRCLKDGADAASFLNRFNVPSMLQEIRVLSGDVPEDPDWLLCRSGELWADLHYANHVHNVPLADCRRRRELVWRQQTAAFAAANTFVLTLGLCEAWFDTRSEAYLDVTPPRPLAPADRGRFEFRFVDYETNLRALEDIHGIIRRCKGDDDFELILTVSPIPLVATFTKSDIVVANAEAKAILRAAAGEAARRFSAVTYFPAYEIAVNSEPAATWMPDGLHVQRSMANHIVATFLGTLERVNPAPIVL